MASHLHETDSGRDRILAFSDGVFAIAITLLILNLVPPHVHSGLLTALGKEWPAYLSYVMSFFFIGIVWANHHQMFRHINRSDHVFLMINVVFLMWVAFIPFPTALLAEYLVTGQANVAMAIYAGTFLVGAILFNALWRYATYNERLLGNNVDRAGVERINRSYRFGPLLYIVDFALAFKFVAISLALFIAMALFYAVYPVLGGDERATATDDASTSALAE